MTKRKISPGVWYLLITALFLVIIIYAPIFTFQKIRAEGMRFLTNEDIVKICNVPYGTPLFSIETDEISKRLLSDLRIEDAVVRKSLPNYLDITIKERAPIATVQAEDCYLGIDKNGIVIDAYNAPKTSEIPNIKGVYLTDMFVGDSVQDENLKKILAFLSALEPKYLAEIKEMECENGFVSGRTVGDIVIRLGNLSNVETKVKLTENFLQDFKKSPIPAEYVDFKYDAPFIKLKEDIKEQPTEQQ